MKNKYILKIAAALCLTLGISTTAYAKVDSYLLKDNETGNIYKYSVEELSQDFMNTKMGEDAPLYLDFIERLQSLGMYSFHDDGQKYVDYQDVLDEFLKSRNSGQAFNLNEYTEKSDLKDADIDGNIYSVTYDDGEVIELPEKRIITRARVYDGDTKLFKEITVTSTEVEGVRKYTIEGCKEIFNIGQTAEIIPPGKRTKVKLYSEEGEVLAEANIDITIEGEQEAASIEK